MALYDPKWKNDEKNQVMDTANYLEATNGQTVKSEIVFIAAFRELQNLAKKHKSHIIKANNITDDEIQWIITVPAIWSEQAKAKMKQWAISAGLVSKHIANQCIIVYEPDCASLAIQKEYFDQNKDEKDDDEKHESHRFEEGDKYILIDAGGGTVDLACHKILGDGCVEEILYPTGDKWGSVYIDDLYIRLLEDIFSKEWINAFRDNCPAEFVEVMDCFQQAKVRFYRNETAKTHSIVLPFEFMQFLEHQSLQYGNTPDNVIRQYRADKNIEYFKELFDDGQNGKNGHQQTEGQYSEKCILRLTETNNDDSYDEEDICYLELDVAIWKLLFDSKIDKIINHVKGLLLMDTLNDCKYLGLVGGFSCSFYFQQRFKHAFGSSSKYDLTVIVPQKPMLCVVQGAAYMAITKNYIKARKLPYTYGVCLSIPKPMALDKGLSQSYISNNTVDGWIKGYFVIIAKKNERVAINENRENVSYRIGKNSIIKILRSDLENPMVEADGKQLCCLEIPHFDADKKCVTEFQFFDTMFSVYAYPKNRPAARTCLVINYEDD